MAEFINTIDVLGDDAVVDSIIDRSVTEFKDNTVSALGIYAFNGCTSLTDVNLPKVTSLPNGAFLGCSSLENVSFENLTYIGSGAFENCTSLVTVDFPLVTGVQHQANFRGCTSLVTARFPKLTSFSSYMFRDCTNLKTVYFPELTSINSTAFFGVTGISGAVFPKVTRIDLFPTADTSITDENFPVVTTLGDASLSGNNLTYVKLSSVTTVGANMFRWVGNVTHVDFPSATSIGGNIGAGSKLSIFVLRNTSAVCTLGGPFVNCPIANGSGHIYCPRALVDSYKVATNWSAYASQFRALEDYTVDGTTTGDLDETKI